MGVEFLVKVKAKKIFSVGEVSQNIKPSPAVWGNKEKLPNWLCFHVTDATKADINKYNRQWINCYDVVETDLCLCLVPKDKDKPGYIRQTVDNLERIDTHLQLFGVESKDIKVSNTDETEVPKTVSVEDLEAFAKDSLEEMYKPRQFLVNSAYITQLVNAGETKVEMTLAEFESELVDQLDG